jgi:hypothetical protein
VFKVDGERVSHTEVSRLLRSDDPLSQRAITRIESGAIIWPVIAEFGYTLRTGQPAVPKVIPDIGAFFAQHPEIAQLGREAMQSKARGDIPAILAAYDFNQFGSVGDIGGGGGHLIKAILQAAPSTRGYLFDLPHIVAAVAGSAVDRLTAQGGDFFKDALPACDAYALMDVIHDFPDERATAILKAVRRAAPPHAKVLLIESLLTEAPGSNYVRLMDMHMLTFFAGRQRTEQEFSKLCAAAGLRLQRTIPTASAFGLSVLETVCA